MEITWLGHGTFQFRLPSGQVIVMDPWIDGNPAYPEGSRSPASTPFASPTATSITSTTPSRWPSTSHPRSSPFTRRRNWLESKGVKNTRAMNKGGSQKVGDVSVTMTHAIHSCGILDDGKIIYGGEAAGLCAALRRQSRALFRRRYQRLFRYGADRATLSSGTGLPAHRRPLHHESTGSRAGLPPAAAAKSDPDAFRHLSRRSPAGRTTCASASPAWKPLSGRSNPANRWSGRRTAPRTNAQRYISNKIITIGRFRRTQLP